jgi:hypothetical protein
MHRTLIGVILRTVVEENATNCERNSLPLAPSGKEFVDTSTWEQIIRVLEESSIQTLGCERRTERTEQDFEHDSANTVMVEPDTRSPRRASN